MGAADLRATARNLRLAADDLDGRAAALDVEAGDAELLMNPVFAVFTPHVWSGPAAGRAWSGYLDAAAALRRAAASIRAKGDDYRAGARNLRARADELDRMASQLEAAAAAAARAAAEAAAAEAAKRTALAREAMRQLA